MPDEVDRRYLAAQRYVEKEFPDLLGSDHAHWFAPLVEAYVEGASQEHKTLKQQSADTGVRPARAVGRAPPESSKS